MTTVLLVDDHELVRMGMKATLEGAGMQVVGEASNGEDAVRLSRELSPELVIMDISMPGIGGMEAVCRIAERTPAPKILIVSTHTNDVIPGRLIEMGVSGYMSKGAEESVFVGAVKTILSGARYIESSIVDHHVVKQEPLFEGLSERELQILIMVAKGISVVEIAQKLYITRKTVNEHRVKIKKKLSVGSDVELARIAIDRGLVDVDIDWH